MLYAEHLHVLIKRTGWIVTKIYAHYTFEQSRFKKGFITMNQVSKQKATTKVEKDFYKLTSNSNFGIDCRNTINSCDFRLIFDDIEEIPYIQKYTSRFFNDDYKDFACPETIKQQIEHECNSEIMELSPNDPCFEAKKYSISQKRTSKINVVDSMIARKKRKKKFKDSKQKTDLHLQNTNTKMIIDFDCEFSISINSLSVNKNSNVKVTTRFFSGKMLMFAKLSLMSFIYELIKTFYFPDEKTKKTYKTYKIEKIYFPITF